jgi:hypothetical protein
MQMKNLARILSVAMTVGQVMGVGTSAMAADDSCRWGGDNGQSLKCFDCQKLVRVGRDWRWVDTCGSHAYSIFSEVERN